MGKIIAITGGIGSGKSTALKILEKLGYKAFNADKIYKELLLNEEFVCKISSEMGVSPLTENGRLVLDRKGIADLVFNDRESLNKLNDLTHPAIMKEMISRAKSLKGLVFCEVPLLYEGGFENLFDYVFIIARKCDLRIKGVSERDKKSSSEVEKIIENQFDYTKIEANKHTFIIDNNGDESSLERNIKVAIKGI